MALKSSGFVILTLFVSLAAYCQEQPAKREPLATIGGQPVYEEELLSLIQPQLVQIRAQEAELRRKYLDLLINQKLADAEAQKRNLTVQQLIEIEVNSKVVDPTDREIEALYAGEKDRINRPLEEVKAEIWQALKQRKQQRASEVYFRALREKAGVEVLLDPPRVEIGYDAKRVRGNKDAPITIIEFGDFQCPFCVSVQPTLRALLAKYDGKVKLAFRDFPLREIHADAQSAAEAARCAGEQGKFWEYHDLVYSNQARLNRDALSGHANTLRLDAKIFNACLVSGKFKNDIEQDLQEGNRKGVSGTPGFFINGVFLTGAQPQSAFERIIENELALQRRRSVR